MSKGPDRARARSGPFLGFQLNDPNDQVWRTQMRPGYPTEWQSTFRRSDDGSYTGVIERLTSPTNTHSASCGHMHGTKGGAQECADWHAEQQNRRFQ